MKKYEILFDWPISEIHRMADSEVADAFSAGLVEPALTAFVKLTEQMRGLSVDLARAKADRQNFGKWSELRECIEQFELKFGAFPNSVIRKFRLSVLLADKLTQAAPPLDNENIDENAFEIRTLTSNLPIFWFSRENSQSFTDSLAVFSCGDMAAFQKEVSSATVSPKFLFHLLAAVNSLPDALPRHLALVKKIAPQIELPAIDAFAKLSILSSGKAIHSTKTYTAPPAVIDFDCIRVGNPYHQWNDVFNVFSEYNGRHDLLLKYLTIYHVVENFMFKRPIVELESQQGGRMFTIRDFRRLYKQVETKEIDAIKHLFKLVGQMEASPGTTFEQRLVSRWLTVFPAASMANVDKMLLALDMQFSHADFIVGRASNFFAQLVYAIRNAVVHNKETELHLTYASLDSTVTTLIESFLMVSLEEICFALVAKHNPQLWYSQDKLFFYR